MTEKWVVVVKTVLGEVYPSPATYTDRQFARGIVRLLNERGFESGRRACITEAWVEPASNWGR